MFINNVTADGNYIEGLGSVLSPKLMSYGISRALGLNFIDNGGSVWVCSMGHLMGLFDNPWLNIEPTNKIAMLRYAEFHKIENNVKPYPYILPVDIGNTNINIPITDVIISKLTLLLLSEFIFC